MDSLYNKKNKEQLIEQLHNEKFNRITVSFCKYIELENLMELRDELYIQLTKLKILGRIYIAEEGINAQISCPENNLDNLKNLLSQFAQFKNVPLKKAVEENDSFYKLIIKVKKEIVAYGISKKQANI